jgi:hypothetical protein
MAELSTALPLTNYQSSLDVNGVRIVGSAVFASSADLKTLNGSPAASATAAEPRLLTSGPSRTEFVVNLTDNVLLQVWEGTVVKVDKDEFTAILRDKTEESNPDEEVVLSTEELALEDRELLRPGAVFYWSIRYEQESGLPRRRVSRIRFRRVPGWTASDIRRAESVVDRVKAIWAPDAQNAAGK